MWRPIAVGLALVLAGCEGALRDPVGLGNGDGGITIGGGGGGGGSGGVLLGTWETQFVIQTANDVQRHTITWAFNSGGTCRRVIEIYSVLEDRTLTSSVNCTFSPNGGQVAITFEGNTLPASFSWSLEHFSPDRLILDGVIYDRAG